MAPLIADRSLVLYRKAGPSEVAPGDIIVFRREDRLIAHRLIATRSGGQATELREKGDNTLRASWIQESSLLGKAVELRGPETRRSLAADTADIRLRCMVAWLRLEADAVDRYLAFRAGVAGARLLAPLLILPAAAAVAAKRLCFPLLLRVYPAVTPAVSAEALRFVVECFRAVLRRSPTGGNPLPPADDWGKVLDIAGSLGILPALALFDGIGPGRTAIPAEVTEQVKKASFRAALNHDHSLRALAAVNGALKGVTRYAILKGPCLYESLYSGLFPREYEDLDIMVPRNRVEDALGALRGIGYEPTGGALRNNFLRRWHFHLALDPARRSWPRIELHWSLVDRANLFRIPDMEFFDRVSIRRSGEIEFSALSAEDEFIYLCLHAAKHGILNGPALRQGRPAEWFCRPAAGNRLTWFADIGLLIEKKIEMDWPEIRRRASRWNVTGAVVECLHVLYRLAPDSAAAVALDQMGASPPPEPSGGEGTGASAPGWAMRMSPLLLIRPVRVLTAWRLAFPTPRQLLRYYGLRSAAVLPFLYLAHPFHMLAKLTGILQGNGAGRERMRP
jgi:hypothetical protein